MAKVLVPFDGSDSALRAAGYAANMSLKDSEVEVTLLIVVNTQNLDFFEASLDIKDRFFESLAESAEATLQKASEIFNNKGITVKKVVAKGDPATTINNYVNENNIDVIVMGTRGLTSLKGMVLGSVSQKLIHLTDKPVTLIK
ncbi:MAG: universal stress protein [Bacillota bacterium]